MRVVFRVDASLQMGTGHVMRCLTLADKLKENGAEVSFICRKHKGNLIRKIRLSGFNVYELNEHKQDKVDNKLTHSHWLGATQEQDSNDCIDILKSKKVNYLIVDHYALDERWQKNLKSYCEKLVVIDDLADRKHQCDILIDQTYGRQKESYKELLPKSCELLLGSQYALLRDEFYKWREYSLKRRNGEKLKNLLVNMGGSDPNNITEEILKEIELCQLPKYIIITVVMGGSSPHLNRVMTIASNSSYKIKVRVDVNNMSELMANSDVAIGATGATTWERCCLGLPSIQIVIAENQTTIANSLGKANIIKLIKKVNQLSLAIEDIQHTLNKMSLASTSIVDGQGANKVAKCILSNTCLVPNLSLKPANYDDCKFIYDLQTVDNRKYYVNKKVPSMKEHVKWFKKTLNSKESQLFVATFNYKNIGLLRIDNLNEKTIEISIVIATIYRGQGIAKKVLSMLDELIFSRNIKAIIHINNIPSIRVFESSGFIKYNQNDDYIEYIKTV